VSDRHEEKASREVGLFAFCLVNRVILEHAMKEGFGLYFQPVFLAPGNLRANHDLFS
jgi:hypothetical protein